MWTFTERLTDGLLSNLCWWQHHQWLRRRWGPSAGVLLTYMGSCWTLLHTVGEGKPRLHVTSPSFYQKHSTHCPSSSSSFSTPLLQPLQQRLKLLEMRRNLIVVHNNKMCDVLLSNRKRAHSLVMFSKIYLKKNPKKTVNEDRKTHLQVLDWSPPECQRSGLERRGQLKCRCAKR